MKIDAGTAIESDEQTARDRAVLISLVKEGGAYRVCLDDAKRQDQLARQWVVDVHYTNKLISGGVFENLEFDEKELTDFGYAIMARLHAFNQSGEP